MPNIRAMVILQGASNLPQDRYVNTFHFSGGVVAYATEVALLAPLVEDFYTTANGLGTSVGSLLSQYVVNTGQINFYNLADPEPRVPTEFTFTIPSRQVTTDLPEEVAICLSTRGNPPITARRRGRVFIGPLNSYCLTDPTTTTPARVRGEAQGAIADAGDRLREAVLDIDNGCVWAIRSVTPSENFVPIFGGWVDNSFDTQRRRGPSPTQRVEWGIPI